MAGFRLQRAADWSPELHQAVTAYELVVNAPYGSGWDERYAEAKRRYGHATLDQDRRRRPAFYGPSNREALP